ncbi:hypothetical protein EYF80_051294 [Liparis tanakae]|uniref:Uncharacterized protein n=1 Tax=Liparis tanakae TaxID=230148 RepID=A0A4Z2FBK8_9TELE|nr:hypothetical protein EYF80_051294 [Liparis tanakae]
MCGSITAQTCFFFSIHAQKSEKRTFLATGENDSKDLRVCCSQTGDTCEVAVTEEPKQAARHRKIHAVKRLWSTWGGVGALLKDTSTCNYGESGDGTGNLGRPPSAALFLEPLLAYASPDSSSSYFPFSLVSDDTVSDASPAFLSRRTYLEAISSVLP